MKVVRDHSLHQFLKEAGDLLYQNEPTNNLMLGLCEKLMQVPQETSPILLRLQENGQTVTAAVQPVPMYLIVTFAQPSHLIELAATLDKIGARPPGVVGPASESQQFAQSWSDVTGCKVSLGMAQKIYKLESVIFPRQVSGSFKPASKEDIETVYQWILAFAKALPPTEIRDDAHWRAKAEKTVQDEAAHLWFDKGKPVSLAFCDRPTRNGVSINGVYTPPEQRGRGYASAVVAHLSQKMLDSGKKFCVLYTDLSNPTSNKIYQQVGFREVVDSKLFIFS